MGLGLRNIGEANGKKIEEEIEAGAVWGFP